MLDLEFKTYLYSLSILSEINPIKVVDIEAGLKISKLFEIGLKDIGLKDKIEKDDDIKSEVSTTNVAEFKMLRLVQKSWFETRSLENPPKHINRNF